MGSVVPGPPSRALFFFSNQQKHAGQCTNQMCCAEPKDTCSWKELSFMENRRHYDV